MAERKPASSATEPWHAFELIDARDSQKRRQLLKSALLRRIRGQKEAAERFGEVSYSFGPGEEEHFAKQSRGMYGKFLQCYPLGGQLLISGALLLRELLQNSSDAGSTCCYADLYSGSCASEDVERSLCGVGPKSKAGAGSDDGDANGDGSSGSDGGSDGDGSSGSDGDGSSGSDGGSDGDDRVPVYLTFRDNGTGLSFEAFSRRLLTLSGSSKANAGGTAGSSVGGFGIAKNVLLLAHSFWDVRSYGKHQLHAVGSKTFYRVYCLRCGSERRVGCDCGLPGVREEDPGLEVTIQLNRALFGCDVVTIGDSCINYMSTLEFCGTSLHLRIHTPYASWPRRRFQQYSVTAKKTFSTRFHVTAMQPTKMCRLSVVSSVRLPPWLWNKLILRVCGQTMFFHDVPCATRSLWVLDLNEQHVGSSAQLLCSSRCDARGALAADVAAVKLLAFGQDANCAEQEGRVQRTLHVARATLYDAMLRLGDRATARARALSRRGVAAHELWTGTAASRAPAHTKTVRCSANFGWVVWCERGYPTHEALLWRPSEDGAGGAAPVSRVASQLQILWFKAIMTVYAACGGASRRRGQPWVRPLFPASSVSVGYLLASTDEQYSTLRNSMLALCRRGTGEGGNVLFLLNPEHVAAAALGSHQREHDGGGSFWLSLGSLSALSDGELDRVWSLLVSTAAHEFTHAMGAWEHDKKFANTLTAITNLTYAKSGLYCSEGLDALRRLLDDKVNHSSPPKSQQLPKKSKKRRRAWHFVSPEAALDDRQDAQHAQAPAGARRRRSRRLLLLQQQKP